MYIPVPSKGCFLEVFKYSKKYPKSSLLRGVTVDRYKSLSSPGLWHSPKQRLPPPSLLIVRQLNLKAAAAQVGGNLKW